MITINNSRLKFPENWNDLYKKWVNKEISTEDFFKQSKVKGATFYNLIREYERNHKTIMSTIHSI